MFITSLGYGGTERNLVQYCKALDRSRFDVTVWYLHESEESMKAELESRGVEVVCLNAPKGFKIGFLLKIARKLKRAVADLIHIFLPTVGYYAIVSKFLFCCKTPMMYSSGGVQFLLPLQKPMMQLGLGRYCYPIVCNSEAVAAFWGDMKVDQRKIRVIYNGHDLDKFEAPLDREAIRKELGVGDADFVIVTVGRLVESKRHTDLLRALSKIDAKKVPFKLLVVGDGPLCDQLASEASELELADRVQLLGRRDDVISILRCSDLFAFPSASEGLPNALIEAALCRLPIVASDIAPVLEIVEDGTSGMIFPVRDADALAAGITKSALNSELASRMAEKAYQDATRAFDLKKSVRLLEQAYLDAVNGFQAHGTSD